MPVKHFYVEKYFPRKHSYECIRWPSGKTVIKLSFYGLKVIGYVDIVLLREASPESRYII